MNGNDPLTGIGATLSVRHRGCVTTSLWRLFQCYNDVDGLAKLSSSDCHSQSIPRPIQSIAVAELGGTSVRNAALARETTHPSHRQRSGSGKAGKVLAARRSVLLPLGRGLKR